MTKADEDAVIQAIAEARVLVEKAGLPADHPLNPIAFEWVLGQLGGRQPDTRPRPAPEPAQSDEEETPLDRIATWADVDVEKLRDLVQVEDSGVQLVLWSRTLPRPKADRQRTVSLIKAGLDRIGWDRETIPSREINGLCNTYDCLDQNLANNLQTRGLFSRRGRRGTYEYRITHAGLQAARDELRRLLDA